MKKITFSLLTVLLIAGCKKNTPTTTTPAPDTTAPVMTLNGKANDTISLNSSYVDPGATAVDETDGGLSVVISGSVNKDLVGTYVKYYNVKDASGNSAAQLVRQVYVKNDAEYLAGNYSAMPGCGATSTSSYTAKVTTSTTKNNKIEFSLGPYYSFPAINPEITVSGFNLSLPFATVGTNGSHTGSGSIATNKKSFVFGYTSNAPNSGWNCSTVFTRQ